MGMADGRRRRRRHSEEFKARVVQACRIPGVSIAGLALAHGLNAHLLRRWVIAEEQAQVGQPGKPLEAGEATVQSDAIRRPSSR